jgi:UDP-3-O-[3-hydroxymyristoyl] N-acetylglucosamine deacetylase
MFFMVQHTIGSIVSLRGIGLHSGKTSFVVLSPAQEGSGRYFTIDDQQIPATIGSVEGTVLSTTVGGIRTVEHLLGALWGMGIDNVGIRVEGEEIPIGDGSALPWVELIKQAGIVEQGAETPAPILDAPLFVGEGDRFVTGLPSPILRFTYGIDFPSRAIGVQWFTWTPQADFDRAVAPARTFTMASQVEQLRAQGLIQGGSLDNAIICDQEKWLNPPLRFADEPCRHKLLDLVGDLSLVPHLPKAHYLAYKASHHLHTQFARLLVTNYGKN